MTRVRRLALAAALGGGTVAIAIAQVIVHAGHGSGYALLLRFVALWAAAGLCYLGMVALLLGERGRAVVLIVALTAAGLRVVAFGPTPFLSTDIYRYVWDGRVQNAGINPYRYIPDAPALGPLRDPDVFERINRADYAPTIYPPVAQMVFAAVGRMSGTVAGMKRAMVFAEAVGMIAMLLLLRRGGLPTGRLAIYACNPVFAWEYAGSGHVDALAIGFVGLALLFATRRRAVLAGIALAAAVLTKFLPVVLAPALWRPREPGARWRFPLAMLVTIVASYGVYASVGLKVLGFLGGYTREEGMENGAGIFALQYLRPFIALPPWSGTAWLALGALVLAALALRIAASRRAATDVPGVGHDALLLALVATIVVSPHYAWYYGWISFLGCLAPWPSAIFLTIACAGYYVDTDHTRFGLASATIGVFAVLAIRDIWRAASPRAVMARSTR